MRAGLHLGRRDEPFDAYAEPTVLPAEGQQVCRANGTDARNGRQPLAELIEGGEALLDGGVAAARQSHERCQHAV